MSYLSYRIALYKLNRKRQKKGEVISKYVEEARRTGGETKAQEVYESERFDLDMIDHEIQYLQTRYLINKARKNFLDVPPFSEESDLWEHSPFTRKYQLTEKGITQIRNTIRGYEKERREKVAFYVNILFGLLGLLIGLIAVIKR